MSKIAKALVKRLGEGRSEMRIESADGKVLWSCQYWHEIGRSVGEMDKMMCAEVRRLERLGYIVIESEINQTPTSR